MRQADEYILALFEEFAAIAEKRAPWRPIGATFGVNGFYRRSRHHFIYLKVGADGHIAIFAILHERMHQTDRLSDVIAASEQGDEPYIHPSST